MIRRLFALMVGAYTVYHVALRVAELNSHVLKALPW